MSLDAASGLLACPVCTKALKPDDRSLLCPGGHRFDVARQGYVNLLGSRQPANADTAEMVAARERIHESGLFDPVADHVARRLALSDPIAEIGAGTAFYLSRALGDGRRGVALDVSVPAARRAAKAHPRIASVVTDAWGTLPLLSARFGGVLCAFAPRNMPEFARVLAQGGLLVVVTPNATHLDTLRQRYGLLGIEDDKQSRLARSAVGLFEPIAKTTLDYRRPVDASGVRDLIGMGPNAFHQVPDEVIDAEVRISVSVHLFRKPGAAQG